MRFRFILLLGTCLLLDYDVKGQKDFRMENYRHTLSRDGGKVTFQVVPPMNQQPIDNRLDYHWFAAGQLNVTRGGFSGQLLDGDFQEFFGDHGLMRMGCFDKGIKTGWWKQWNQQGTLLRLEHYAKGRRNGRFSIFDEQGRLQQSGRYSDDQLQGRVRFYKGDTLRVERYRHGVIVPKRDQPIWPLRLIFWKKRGKR